MQLPTGDVLLLILERVAVADVLSVGACCKALREVTSDDAFWRGLAERKWGPRALELRPAGEAGGSSWMAYAIKRMNLHTIRRSPLELGQERYPDPWMHIICCVLCSRTSGSAVVRDTISRFLGLFPTPSAVLDAPDDVITGAIHPLGLQPTRLRAVRSVSEGFLSSDWEDPSEFYGCGKFVADSWRIFCRGDLSGAGVEDRNLRAYVAWAKRDAAGLAAGADEEEEEAAGGGGAKGGAKRPAPPAESARARRLAAREAAAAGGGIRLTRGAAAAAAAAAAGRSGAGPSVAHKRRRIAAGGNCAAAKEAAAAEDDAAACGDQGPGRRRKGAAATKARKAPAHGAKGAGPPPKSAGRPAARRAGAAQRAS